MHSPPFHPEKNYHDATTFVPTMTTACRAPTWHLTLVEWPRQVGGVGRERSAPSKSRKYRTASCQLREDNTCWFTTAEVDESSLVLMLRDQANPLLCGVLNTLQTHARTLIVYDESS